MQEYRLIKKLRTFFLFLSAIIYIRPNFKSIISLLHNKEVEVNFKYNGNKIKLKSRRNNLLSLYFLRKLKNKYFEILDITNDEIVLKFKEHRFRFPISRINIELLNKFQSLIDIKYIDIIEVKEKGVVIKINQLNSYLESSLKYLIPSIVEMLDKRIYYWDVDVKNKVVVDVGAYIGDSAVFFASRGAKVVYAYEPSKELYEIAKRNCSKFNNIKLFNFGLADFEGEAKLFGELNGKRISEKNGKEIINVKPFENELLKIIASEGKINILKIDCEGCEWSLMKIKDIGIMNNIDTIVVEIHGRNHELLLNFLNNCNFKILNIKRHPNYSDITMYTLLNSKIV